MRALFSVTWITILVAVAVLAALLAGAWYAQEKYTSRSEFCGGTCHTMTEQYLAWQNDRHHASKNPQGKQADCVTCHFLPGEKNGFKAKMEGLRHLAAYLYNPDAPLPIRPKVPSGSCLQSGCHAQAELEARDIQFTEKVRFNHKPHLGDKALAGQELACDTCHFKVTAEKHFEVPTEICALCHLKKQSPTIEQAGTELVMIDGNPVERITFEDRPAIDFNSGLSRCSTCHTIPTRSLQGQLSAEDSNVKPITHQTIQAAGVACESCHFDVVEGHGEVETGNVVSNGCLTCHNRSAALMAKATDGKLMHDAHVTPRTADCFDCHTVIEHKNRTDHLDAVRQDCALCHQDEHLNQKILLSGTPVAEDIQATPHLMFKVNTNCMACHLKKEVSQGHIVRKGAPETCVACHTPEHAGMLADWRKQLETELAAATEIELEADAALAAARQSGIGQDILSQAEGMIAAGKRYLEIVRVGNGVHNKKYAITILDQAFVSFEETIDLLDSGG